MEVQGGASSAGSPTARSGWYDRCIAWGMANTMASYEAALQPIKQQLFGTLAATAVQGRAGSALLEQQEQLGADALALALAPESGVAVTRDKATSQPQLEPFQVLELGMGTGPNLKYLLPAFQQECARNRSKAADPNVCSTPAVQVTGIDPNQAMQQYARKSAEAAGLPQGALQLVEGQGERLPWPDNTFDAVVCTLVLCTVPDPGRAVAEVRRVLKPSGQLLFIEHVAAAWEDDLWKRTAQEVLTPLQGLLAGGCHLNRETWKTLQQAGFSQLKLSRQSLQGVPGIVAPHAWGIAIK